VKVVQLPTLAFWCWAADPEMEYVIMNIILLEIKQ